MSEITKESAIELAKSSWWKFPNVTPESIVRFQLFEKRLCMDFKDFHQAVEDVLGRPVWFHEFAFINEPNGLKAEYLEACEPPTFTEILELIPQEKRFLITLEEGENE